jgi:hypothetical protein
MAVKANKSALLAVLLVLLLAPAAAFAALAKVGPVVPYNAATHTGNGYPRYYMDANGVAVDLPVPPFGDAVNPPTMIYGPVDPNNPFSVDIGFDAEVFFFHVQPDRTTFDDVIGGNVNIVIGLEAGFANASGLAENGQQAVWQRIRFNWVDAPNGFYKFFHPYGVETLTAAGGTGIKHTVDTGVINIPPFNFSLALAGPIGPFLLQVNPPPLIAGTPPPGFNKPTDWLGDGVTPATFTGSPLNPPFNKFRIEAYTDATFTTPLNIFVGNTTNVVETSLAVIAGHRYHPPNLAGQELLLLLD